MAKKSLSVFSNPDGYRFVDESGVTTAVLETSGRFSLRSDNASLEVHESWKDFVKEMQEAPTTSTNEEEILNQLSGLGLGRWEPIDVEPKTRIQPKEIDMAKEASIADKKKKLEEIQKAKKAAAAKPAKAKVAKEPATLNDCLCGCGEKTARSFKQGHDARCHGWFKKVERGEMKLSEFQPITQKWMKEQGVKPGSKKTA